jgi:phenylacetate-CoA ligase
MTCRDFTERRRWEGLEAPALAQAQLMRLNQLLTEILPRNRFYAEKLSQLRLPLESLEQLAELPFTVKTELERGPDEFAANLSYPVDAYAHCHRTSGTRGRPLLVLDTAEDWAWWIDTWQYVLDVADLGPADRGLMAFSYGPYIGFWTAHDAVLARGALVIPGGGLRTLARLEFLRSTRATALFCTPSYALHLAEVAANNHFDIAALPVRCLIVAGEPGGSVPATRQRIETAWHARVIDHAGATEVGPWGYADRKGTGLYVVESEFIAEFLAVGTDRPAGLGEISELVLTTLGRSGCPVIRYRTGDLVRPRRDRSGANRFIFLEGGVLSRVDDMMVIRGVNVFPSSVEQILRSFSEIAEYRLLVSRLEALDVLTVEIEDRLNRPERVARELLLRLGLQIEVRSVPLDSLPRFEGKGRRFVDQRV